MAASGVYLAIFGETGEPMTAIYLNGVMIILTSVWFFFNVNPNITYERIVLKSQWVLAAVCLFNVIYSFGHLSVVFDWYSELIDSNFR